MRPEGREEVNFRGFVDDVVDLGLVDSVHPGLGSRGPRKAFRERRHVHVSVHP